MSQSSQSSNMSLSEMSLSSQSPSKSDTKPYIGSLKIFPLAIDASKMNAIFYTGPNDDLQHLKITDKDKGSKLRLSNWFKLRGYKFSNGSYVMEKTTSLSPLSLLKPEISDEKAAFANQLLQSKGITAIATAKSERTADNSKVTVFGKIVCKGILQNKFRAKDGQPFTLQNFRLADGTGTIRVTVFNKNNCFTLDKCYKIYNIRKNIYMGKSTLQLDEGTVFEELPSTDITFSTDMSDDEGKENLIFKGIITGLICGSVNFYNACGGCMKKVTENNECPRTKPCNKGVKKSVYAKVDIEYADQEGDKDAEFQVFEAQLNILQGKSCEEYATTDDYEQAFNDFCPIHLNFKMNEDQDDKKKLIFCEVLDG